MRAHRRLPGQWDYARQPSRKELAVVHLLALSLEEAAWPPARARYTRRWTGIPDRDQG